MNNKQCKKARKEVYGDSSRRNPFEYETIKGTVICTGLRCKYQRLKDAMKRYGVRLKRSN